MQSSTARLTDVRRCACTLMTSTPRPDPPHRPPVDGAPAIFVGLLTAQEVELARIFADRLRDRVADQDRPWALLGISRIEAAEIGIGAAAVVKSVIGGDSRAIDREQPASDQTVSI